MLPEVRPARTVHFAVNFVRQKLEDTPGLGGPVGSKSVAGPPLGREAGPGVLPEVRPARTVCFPENFIRQKLENALSLVGAGHVR